MLITRHHVSPPSQSIGIQLLQMVEEYVTDLSMLSVPASNPLYEVYRWALPIEVGAYIQRIGMNPNEPVELLLAVDEADPKVLVGFILYSPVPTHPEACGINYMAVSQSHRRRGIGQAMLKELIALYPHVELTCTIKKVPFYEAAGFIVLDAHDTQVVMNTRSASTPGMMAVVDVTSIYKSQEANEIHNRLVQRWGVREMRQAEKHLARHVAQLERQVKTFVEARRQSEETAQSI
ncbi:GNAT family N-acetyltransferase [Stutzerimonas stutzeri]|uniref:GNAT family N-acetyltransferase n=1 Tax=Stutzerimonas stutzeri TaxID=316 RepID=UPI001BD015CF|nr:GNAT family N-acetyltransferase [Stutzerimonas stutzeri]